MKIEDLKVGTTLKIVDEAKFELSGDSACHDINMFIIELSKVHPIIVNSVEHNEEAGFIAPYFSVELAGETFSFDFEEVELFEVVA